MSDTKVKIAYTVSVSEIRHEVAKLYRRAVSDLKAVITECDMTDPACDSVSDVLVAIDKIRKLMFSVDTNFDDCVRILADYQRMLAEIHSPSPPVTPPLPEND
jgi:BioD-like phosphotransacetylase family protein